MTQISSPVPTSRCPGAMIWWLEQDRALSRLVSERLRRWGWEFVVFHHLADLLSALKTATPDLLMLEWQLPGGKPLAALLQLRSQGLPMPVLILSALADADHRIEGLAAGADDYLVKPFHLAELAWRLEHLLQASLTPQRLRPRGQRLIQLGNLMVDPGRTSLRDSEGMEHRISRGDLALLLVFVRRPGQIHPREELLRASGSLVDASTSRTLDVRLSRLRRLLRQASAGEVTIETVLGQGYRLRSGAPAPSALARAAPVA
ncbi:MAG: response regulator transcription factor [Cyanobium sp.]